MRRLEAAHAIAVLLCVVAVAARAIVGPHVTDDAYITMRYSRNLSASGVMSYNPPDAVLGTSTPLWTWILAAGDALGIAPERMAVVTASAADIGSIVILVTTAGASIATLAAAATIAAWPAYVTYAVSGMETSLYVLTIVSFVAALSGGRTVLAAIAAAAGLLCRPDGALLVVIGCVWTSIADTRAAALRFAGVAVLLCAPWLLYAFVRFGSVVPASVTAKAAAVDPWSLSLQNLQAYFLHGIYLPLTLLAIYGDKHLFARTAVDGASFREKRPVPLFRIWSVWAWAYLAGMTVANAFTHFPWYFVPLLPIYIASAATGVERIVRTFWQRWRRTAGSFELGPAAHVALTAVLSAVLLTRMPPLKAYLDSAAAGRETLYAAVATELAGVNARCTVAATEIGTIGYHYPGKVLDLVGLVSPEVIGRPLNSVLAEGRPRWLVTYDTHFDRTVAGSAPFSQLFERRSTIHVSDARTLEVYERRDRSGCSTQ